MVFEPEAKCYHFNRPTWLEYFKQQLQYGKNTLKLYFKRPKLVRGDKITDFGMNLQPVLLAFIFVSVILGLTLEKARVMLCIAAFTLVFLLTYYVIYAMRISLYFRDPAAMLLVIVYFVRAMAWTLGGTITVLKALKADRGKDQNWLTYVS